MRLETFELIFNLTLVVLQALDLFISESMRYFPELDEKLDSLRGIHRQHLPPLSLTNHGGLAQLGCDSRNNTRLD